jgi:hypothetical protein
MRLAQSRTADGPAVPVAAYGGRWFGLSPVLGLRLRVNGELRTCGQETSSRSRSIASAVSGRP